MTFYRAEDYRQEYFAKTPEQPYCAFVIAPKVVKFRQKFAGKPRTTHLSPRLRRLL